MGGRGSGGANAKTVQQHLRDGTYNATRHKAKTNPEPTRGEPEPPGPLAGAARREWRRMVKLLAETQLLTVVDGPMLYHYCQLHADSQQASRDLARLRRRLSQRKLTTRQIMELQRQQGKLQSYLLRYRQQIRVFLTEFGLSPASRGRVNLSAAGAGIGEPGVGPTDEMSEFDRPLDPLTLAYRQPS